MEDLVIIQENTLTLILNSASNFKKTPKTRLSNSYVKVRIQTLEEYWQTFRDTHLEILKTATTEERNKHDYFRKDMFSTGEDKYITAKSEMAEILETFENKKEDHSGKHYAQEVQLPKINIPQFTGNYHDWGTFNDLYTSLIHKNESLSNVQKLHYLKSSVTGEAEQLLKHIQVTDKNYQVAWEVLKQRYQNKRIIVNAIFNRFLSQKKLHSQTSKGIKELLDTTTECLNNLKNYDIKIENWDPLLIHLIVNKLDQDSHKLWEEELNTLPVEELPAFQRLSKFLEGRFRVLEMVQTSQPREKDNVRSKSFHISTLPSVKIECAYCKGNHLIFNCKEFAKLEPEKRSQYVQGQRLCFNCLWPGHIVKNCRHNTNCRRCKRKHHSLLHSSKPNREENNTVTISTEEQNILPHPNILSHMSTQGHVALLATALVNIETGRGKQTVRALLDPCSQETFISEATVNKLQLRRTPVQGQVTGVGKMSAPIMHAAEIEISSRVDNFHLKCTAYEIKHVTDVIPVRKVNHEHWTQFNNLTLADPTYHTPGQIDMLLGVKIYTEVIMNGIIKGNPGTPMAQQTRLGWVLSGGVQDKVHGSQGNIVSMHLNVSLEHMLQRFWESETLETNNKITLTLSEQRAEEIYERTLAREEDGRYIVSLPFKRDIPIFPEHSKEIAKQRLKSLEKKLSKNKELRIEYNNVLREAIILKHMELVEKEENNGVYLPHHAVVQEDKDTTKVRVVYDASCQGSNGIALNDELLIGPTLQAELRDIIMRWRIHRICFVADIVKMYRQIKLHRKDTDCQRIVWRFSEEEEIKDYRLLTVTFGMACAPYLAIKTLRQVAKDEGTMFPLASNIIQNDFYMDDVLSGCDEEEDAIQIQKQLTEMLLKGKFELQKWASNSKRFMEEIAPEKRANVTKLDINRKDCIKTLGIIWEINDDKLNVTQRKIDITIKEVNTKRNILRQIASLFDPMGWLSPAIVVAKIIMQKLWLRKLDWDEELPQDLKEEWIRYKEDLPALSEIKIDRWIGSSKESSIELHGFCDASQTAYAAVVYARVIHQHGTIDTSLIMSKTKVAPVKQLSLPRLELCGAILLCKLLHHVMKTLNIDLDKTYAWTDSKVVLAWIKGDPNKWTPFVKNRVIEIRNTLDNHWLYVNTKENPADPASRGVMPSKLKDYEIWWRGPTFLQQADLTLPSEYIPETNIEKRTSIKCAATNLKIDDKDDGLTFLLKRYSSLKKLLDVVAYCRRWLKILKRERDLPAHITCEERDEALVICLKIAQEIEFHDEISNIKRERSIKRTSRLLPLSPYLDDKGLLRVGGRLKHADMEMVKKHPIILTKDNALIPVLLDEAHNSTLHGGPQLMTSYLRSKYWIIKGGQKIKKFYRLCQICARFNATPKNQLMGNLPDVRVNPSRPFLISGVDFAGPIPCRTSKGRGNKTFKAYICLFVCMATRAIHLELVSDMTTQAFIASFKRFVARRGHCQELWSDHGTTFIAAEQELLEMWRQGKNELPEELEKLLDDKGTRWKYIPPGAPNFGGLWEAGVKSTKYHLKRILRDSTLTFEELYTVLTQIEACLNSRPLAPLGDDLDFLTPGHFLIGESVVTIPDRSHEKTKITSLTRWQLLQRMLQDFWKRWQSDYLSRLQERTKWRRIQKEFEIGDLVLLKDSRLPPANWRLGRIQKKHPGSDGLTRTYDVRTKSGLLQRPISKLCRLPN